MLGRERAQPQLQRSDTTFGGQQPKAVGKAFAMLEAVAAIGPGATARSISAWTSIPPATCYRMLNFLVAEGFLVRVPDLSGFALGTRTAELAHAASSSSVGDRIKSVVAGVRDQVRFAVNLLAFDSTRLRVLDRDPDHEFLDEADTMRYLHASAPGKLMLAHRPELLETISLLPLTANTIIRIDVLRAQLETIAGADIVAECDEFRIGRSSLAVPYLRNHRVVGALTMSGPSSRLSMEDGRTVSAILAAAEALADASTDG